MKIFLAAIIFLSCPPCIFAQTIVQQPLPVKGAIQVELVQMPHDDAGTDVRNIYTISIKNTGGELKAPYAIVYILDGEPLEIFRNQPLPFSFKRNFKGQTPGRHEIKIIIEGQNELFLASQAVNVDVVKNKK